MGQPTSCQFPRTEAGDEHDIDDHMTRTTLARPALPENSCFGFRFDGYDGCSISSWEPPLAVFLFMIPPAQHDRRKRSRDKAGWDKGTIHAAQFVRCGPWLPTVRMRQLHAAEAAQIQGTPFETYVAPRARSVRCMGEADAELPKSLNCSQ